MGRARSEVFTLHQTGLSTVPSPVLVNGANDAKTHFSLKFIFLSQDEREQDENDPFSRNDRAQEDKMAAMAKAFESKYVSK